MSVRKEIHELWLNQATASNGQIRLGNHVRICRNLQGHIFPAKGTSVERREISQQIQKACGHLTHFKRDWVVLFWSDCTDEERRVLTRSCRLDFPCEETVIAYHKNGHEEIIINDGDALRIQATSSELSLSSLWKSLDRIDSRFQDYLPYAFDPEKGYATALPSACGNGLDVRVLVHIPALCFMRKLLQMQEALKTMQLKMDAIEVTGDRILGHRFFITNAVALGCAEEDLLKHIDDVTHEIVQQEEALRMKLWKDNASFIKDSISRAMGVLSSCYELTFEEGMNLISVILMGMDMGLVPSEKRDALLLLWASMQRDYLSEFCGKTFDTHSENEVRSDAVRAYFEAYKGALTREVDHVS